MALDLGSLTRTATLNQSASLAMAKRGGAASDPFEAANQRVQQQLSSTSVKLSSFSKIQSGFADVKAAAAGLSDPKKTGTADDIAKAAQSFAAAFNNATGAVNSAVKGDGKQGGVLAGDGRASIVANDLRSIVSTGGNRADLKKVGIDVRSDGTVSVDTAALQNALKSDTAGVKDALSRIGKFAEGVSAKELSANGNVGRSVNALNDLGKGLETQLAEQKKLAVAFQDNVQKQTSAISGNAAYGIASYLQTFSM